MQRNDGELIRRWKSGEIAAFEELVRRWDVPIGRFLSRLVGQTESVQDLKQEVFLRMYQSGAGLRENGTFRPWLYRVALNVARDQLRRPRMLQPLDDGESVPEPSEHGAECERQEVSELICQAIQQLPVPLREALVLRHYEEMSFEEMSRLLQVPSSTLKSRFATALMRLRTRLKHLDIFDGESKGNELS